MRVPQRHAGLTSSVGLAAHHDPRVSQTDTFNKQRVTCPPAAKKDCDADDYPYATSERGQRPGPAAEEPKSGASRQYAGPSAAETRTRLGQTGKDAIDLPS